MCRLGTQDARVCNASLQTFNQWMLVVDETGERVELYDVVTERAYQHVAEELAALSACTMR